MTDLTVFANFFIDTQERYLRMMDSYRSFCDICPAKWVVNIRGRYRNEAGDFLRENIREEGVITFKHSKQGWFHDTAEMLDALSTNYVFMWVEDHINIGGVGYFNEVLNDMKTHSVDILCYTFHRCIKDMYRETTMYDGGGISWVRQEPYGDPGIHLIPYASIMRTNVFRKVILNPPAFVERTWRVDTPFDFERPLESVPGLLPLVTGLPKKELFAAIDDDRGQLGYSLQQRGLYPVREMRKKHVQWRNVSFLGVVRHVFIVMPRIMIDRWIRRA